MLFSVDNNKKIIFGWSAKCGCSHIKRIFLYLKTGGLQKKVHIPDIVNKLPDDIENYKTIIFTRNPYERIVSGFLDKYGYNRPLRHMWKNSFLSFSQFVDKLIECDWNIIEKHHFTPQTTEKFDKKILLSKIIKFYDIKKIDYKYIEQLYNKKIPEYVIDKKEGHEKEFRINTDKYYEKYVYNLNIDEYSDYNVNIKYFYSQEIMKKVFFFYIEDFKFFKENGIDYIETKF